MLDTLKAALFSAFEDISAEFERDGIKVLMPTYAPQYGKLLSEFAKVGGKVHISGGKKGQPAFGNVPQSGLDFDTTAYINMFPKGMSKKIVGAMPDELLQDKKVALFTFIPPSKLWSNYIKSRGLNTEIVASNEQNTRLFFEKKGNLVHVLQEAGLDAYVIPTAVVAPGESIERLRETYARIRNESGKVVVQPCVESYEQTVFIDNEQDFIAKMTTSHAPLKVARFIEGSEGNLSLLVCNSRPADDGRGVTKCNLPRGIDLNDPSSLARIEAHAAQFGIDESNVFTVTGRATLKAVGDILLANERCDSVGNNIGHIYEENVARQITEIGEKLGRKMGLSGKVGLAGADLIIDRAGKVWINEINDRQQGPTDQMSFDAEAAGLPGLSRMAWFLHFADFAKEKNLGLLSALRDNADAIHQGYMTSEGSFYIKAYANHSAEFNGKVAALQALPSGLYVVSKQDGQWKWEAAPEGAKAEPIDLSTGRATIRISHGSLVQGDKPLSGAEMFRITGKADGENSPFIIENGSSRLSPKWEPIIERLYKDCFGEDYLQKNPLRKPGAPAAKNSAPASAPAAQASVQKSAKVGL